MHDTVEPLHRGHLGSVHCPLWIREVVHSSEMKYVSKKVPLWSLRKCPLLEGHSHGVHSECLVAALSLNKLTSTKDIIPAPFANLMLDFDSTLGFVTYHYVPINYYVEYSISLCKK